ncbi:MAG: esterase-like activity of phytase family protein [Gimesia sp.]|nr:esterase-like activity of phytase family protein [Gimesia sp.]
MAGGISAIDYNPANNQYLAVPDRGPKDGAVNYRCRVQTLTVEIDPNKTPSVVPTLVSTTMLKDNKDRSFVGRSSAYQPTKYFAQRFDPEGIRIDHQGDLFISDEYGPNLIKFSPEGKELRRITIPERYLVKHPADSKKKENGTNHTGRQSNRGMEGLAITRDGRYLVGLMQSPLLQDSMRKPNGKPTGTNCRMLMVELKTGKTKEFLYQLDHEKNKLNEILIINGNEFLVIERDGEAGRDAKFKKIVKINIEHASDIKSINSLPAYEVPASVTPVKKEVFIDLLAPEYGLAGSKMPEKIEGLTFGPKLKDGRRTLLIASDNDFLIDQPTLIYVFAFKSTNTN